MVTQMNHKRITEISIEMVGLLDQQRTLLSDTSPSLARKITQEELEGYTERNERLRELWGELSKLG
jgi:hypothetical protein